ncbi:hypothetical protein GOHSU_43_00120 [Gordonia hirsuta DSM 44140 = NBRC 16056]|uniref:Uncharacterized protein n=1 Tax=Gordonia hirsuta DSM 44140 = NBRC 16056 TaxID=1121927 RepID=L7LEV3_9ACTN|nr:hypothetical protein [Gordonia hirsuta]GAC58568.1 hypothetical protein GOHSU_43_00120 [Gordonia hirsuta DSM 44140 = NBRC 16056]
MTPICIAGSTRTRARAATVLFAAGLGLILAGCGTEQQAPDSSQAAHTPPADRSIPVVGGVSPPSRDSAESPSSAPKDADECGRVGGPDGSLFVRLAGGDVTCETAMSIAKQYSPLISTGEPQTVSGWDCGPSAETHGELARCTKDNQIIAFTAI